MHTAAVQNMKILDLKIKFHLCYSAQQSENSHEKKYLVMWNADPFMLRMHVRRKVWERQKAVVGLFDFQEIKLLINLHFYILMYIKD